MQPLLQKNHINFEHDPDDHEDAQIDKLMPREHEIARLTSKVFQTKKLQGFWKSAPYRIYAFATKF